VSGHRRRIRDLKAAVRDSARLDARAWARSHPEITGSILRRDIALRAGINEFGTLLRPAYSDASAWASKTDDAGAPPPASP
jgi:hypothetical protein